MFTNSQVSLHQAIHTMDAPSKTSQQDHNQNDDDQSRKSPAEQEVEKIASLCVLIIHYQYLPEVYGLGKKKKNRSVTK